MFWKKIETEIIFSKPFRFSEFIWINAFNEAAAASVRCFHCQLNFILKMFHYIPTFVGSANCTKFCFRESPFIFALQRRPTVFWTFWISHLGLTMKYRSSFSSLIILNMCKIFIRCNKVIWVLTCVLFRWFASCSLIKLIFKKVW